MFFSLFFASLWVESKVTFREKVPLEIIVAILELHVQHETPRIFKEELGDEGVLC